MQASLHSSVCMLATYLAYILCACVRLAIAIHFVFCFNVEKQPLIEYEAFIQFYNELITVFQDRSYLAHFVPTKIISPSDAHYMYSLPDYERAMCLLKNISAPLEYGEKQSFDKMLEIMRIHGKPYAQQLVGNMKEFIITNANASSDSAEAIATPNEDDGEGKVIFAKL